MGKAVDSLKFNFVASAQIIQTKGSYSFPLSGMIIACLGFILFIGLLLFHRMHRNYLTGVVCRTLFCSVFDSVAPAESLSASRQEHPKGPPWWRNRPQSRRDLPSRRRKRTVPAESRVPSEATLGYETMSQSVSECCRCFHNACQKTILLTDTMHPPVNIVLPLEAKLLQEFGFKGFFVFSRIICIHGLVWELKERRSEASVALNIRDVFFVWISHECRRKDGEGMNA